ncbi:MAG: hypothetical protein AAFV29_04320, partial [Myxococcota bacterium]
MLSAVGEALMGTSLPDNPVADESESDATVDAFRPSDVKKPSSGSAHPIFTGEEERPTTHMALPQTPSRGISALSDEEAEDGTIDGIAVPGLAPLPAQNDDRTVRHRQSSKKRGPPKTRPQRKASPPHVASPPISKLSPARAISNLPAEEKAALEAVMPSPPTDEDLISPSRLVMPSEPSVDDLIAPSRLVVPSEPSADDLVAPSRLAAPSEPSVDDLVAPRRATQNPGGRNRQTRAQTEEPRPRASMHHVRSLYAALLPFAEELIPLAYERRSRRFWARWREVAGNRGVRRPFVEDLLREAKDTRSLICALISEVQSVDLASVVELVDRLEAPEPAPAAPPV